MSSSGAPMYVPIPRLECISPSFDLRQCDSETLVLLDEYELVPASVAKPEILTENALERRLIIY